MKLSLIIPTHRRPRDLERLLRSLAMQDFPPADFEVIIVSNLPDNRTADLVAANCGLFQNLHYLELARVGVNGARNAGLRRALGEIVYFMDDDCEIANSDHFQKLMAMHEQFYDALAIGGHYVLPPRSSALARAYHARAADWMDLKGKDWQISWRLVGGNVSYKKTSLKSGGFEFDPTILFGGAESELHSRLGNAGALGILHASIPIIHHCHVNAWQFIRKAIYQGMGAGRINSKALAPSPAPLGYWQHLYENFFAMGEDFGRRSKAPPGKISFGLVIQCLRWSPVIFIPRRKLRSVFTFLYWRIRNLYWKSCGLYWKSRGLYWKARGIYWQSRSAIKIFVLWKILDPAVWIFHLFTRWTPVRQGPRARTPVFALKFLWNCAVLIRTRGSRTSVFLNGLWKARTFSPSPPAVYIPGMAPSRIVEFAKTAAHFGFKNLLLMDDIFAAPEAEAVCQTLRDSGFQIEIVFDWRSDRSDPIKSLAALGCKMTPRLSQAPKGQNRVAIGPGISMDALRDFKKQSGEQNPRFTYVDIFQNETNSPKEFFQFTCEYLMDPKFNNSPLELNSIYQPFLAGKNRFLEGRVVWQNHADPAKLKWSVILPCYQCQDYLPRVITHLLQQDYDLQQLEIVLVDDGSEPTVETLLKMHLESFREQPCLLKIMRVERGEDTSFRAALARNAGVLESRGEKILFLDADIILARDHLKKLDAALEQADVIQSVRLMLNEKASSNLLEVEHINHTKDIYRQDYYWEKFNQTSDWNELSAPWKYVCSYALAIRRQQLLQLGLFRPEFSEYGFEDTELGYRLFREGLRFALLKSPVYHLYPVGSSWSTHFDQQRRLQSLSNMAKLFYRMHGDPSIFYELRTFLTSPVKAHRPKQKEIARAMLLENSKSL